MMYCWNCEAEFDFSSSVIKVNTKPYSCNQFLCPYCRSKDIEEVVEDYLLKDSNNEEVDYFSTEKKALEAQKGFNEKLRVLTGESIEQEF